MDVLKTREELRRFAAAQRESGRTLSFVPTMGALHEGHMALVREGLRRADVCIPYIFVNPAQFAPTEDLASYPRTPEADLEKLEQAGARIVYMPQVQDVYPDGFSTSVSVKGVSEPLEGQFRPHMFGGVATVLTKMFLQCLPDVALFGEKDYQQLLVIRKFVKDLDIPVEIAGVPIVRDENGLALSSRNAYLDAAQYKVAIQLNKILSVLAIKAAGGDIAELERQGTEQLVLAGFEKVDYCVIRDAHTLLEPAPGAPLRVLAAAKIGRARLIDNMAAI